MANEDFVVDSTLCFINSARSDYSYESLFDVAYAFYSHEEIKSAKETICVLLKKDLVWRRDPEKKKKDLRELLDYHEEFKNLNKHAKFVTTSHKKMTPVGLEMFAPILTNLAEDIMKLNDVTSKILDIKSEVCNTADTVRQMQLDVKDLKKKFTYAVSGMEGAAKNLSDNEVEVLSEIRSFRQSIGSREINETINTGLRNDGFDQTFGNEVNSLWNNAKSYADMLAEKQHSARANSPKKNAFSVGRSPTALVTDRKTGATSKKPQLNRRHQVNRDITPSTPSEKENNIENRDSEDHNTEDHNTEEGDKDGWSLVDRRGKRRKKSTGNFGIKGSRKDESCGLKAAVRRADVFVGRVDTDVTVNDIKEFIERTFTIEVFSVSKLDIFSDVHNAFKISVKANVRDKLFESDKWPEDIIVDKFYNKRNKSSMKDNVPTKQS